MTTELTEHAKERSTYVVTVSFVDESGAAVTPSAATWTLTNKSGTVINSRTDVAISPLSTSANIVMTGADLAMTEQAIAYRILTVEYTYTSSLGSGLAAKYDYGFWIDGLVAVP